MNTYQVMIEGVFVRSPELGRLTGGFHTTFFVMAINAANASHKVNKLLAKRMAAHSVVSDNAGWFMAYYWVHDIWEVTVEKYSENEGHDSGFTFFIIGRMEKLFLAVRRLFFNKYRQWLLVQPELAGSEPE
ncbi:hypothetical protein VDF90_09550 [Xanthomonas campestris pv. raphani]|uniref:hypothetical protein n=2 Tax=Xanthomonas campestris TaxID=339 RepID=UPI000CDA7EA4|nr:hypothetical protein [Xanthomonas campestris]MCW1979509.1 hypothetical protein [Xanthomonas campestris]MEA0737228.1 hypothetical protein [Xanthomonas campestris pv. campestris]MEA9787489.1 hypothetical protein [Xanthomonas campestris pv. raphani]RJU09205.1 hypothetical protein XcmpCFBP7700_19655 [Xanthomonas campestris]TXD44698.1 hypothetical protein TR80_004760 [Xanthomonas campestris]